MSSTVVQPTVVDGRTLSAAALVAGVPVSAASAAQSCNAAAATAPSWEAAAAVALSPESAVTAGLSWEAAAATAPISDSPVSVALGAHSPPPKSEERSERAVRNPTVSRGAAATAGPISDCPSVPEAGLHSPPKFAAAATAAWLLELLQCASDLPHKMPVQRH